MKKRICSIMLATAICLSSLPVTSFAMENNTSDTNIEVDSNDVNNEIAPRASVRTHYKTTPYAGKSKEYKVVRSTYKSNLYDARGWVADEASAAAAIITPLCPIAGTALGVAGVIAGHLPLNPKRLYFKVTVYTRNTSAADQNENQKRITRFYEDSSYKKVIAKDTVYIQNIYF